MSAKATPGPWFNNDGLVNGRDSRERFQGSTSVDIFDAAEWPSELHEEALANAALIAAAPSLVEALDRLAGEIRGAWGAFEGELRHALGNTNYQIVLDRIESARAVLRLARGE